MPRGSVLDVTERSAGCWKSFIASLMKEKGRAGRDKLEEGVPLTLAGPGSTAELVRLEGMRPENRTLRLISAEVKSSSRGDGCLGRSPLNNKVAVSESGRGGPLNDRKWWEISN